MAREPPRYSIGSTGVRLVDLLDAWGSLDEGRVEWRHEGASAFSRLNGYDLEARQVGYDFAIGLINGAEAVDRADTRVEIMTSLLSAVTFRPKPIS